MAQPNANSLKGRIAKLERERNEARAERDRALRDRGEAVRMAHDATEAAKRAERECAEKIAKAGENHALALMAAEGRIKTLKGACAQLEREIAERDGYIRRVNEGDDIKAELAPTAPIDLQPRSASARRRFLTDVYFNPDRVDWASA